MLKWLTEKDCYWLRQLAPTTEVAARVGSMDRNDFHCSRQIRSHGGVGVAALAEHGCPGVIGRGWRQSKEGTYNCCSGCEKKGVP